MKAPEQVMLDEPAMAKGHGFFAVGDTAVSQDNRLLAYAEDVVGRRQYKLKVKDLRPARGCPTSSTMSSRTWSGPTTTAPFTISRRTR